MEFNIKNVVLSAVFAALVFVATAFLPKIPIPPTGGYAHIGDAFIYIAATLMSPLYAALAAAVGASLADIVLGYTIYSPFTFFIKAFMALCLTYKSEKALSARNIIGAVLAGLINIAGYFAAEGIIYGNFISPVASIPYNVAQSAASLVLFIVTAIGVDRVRLKQRISQR